ncbi:hypothetical protein D3C77_331510 [compost metagenome]
MLFIRLKVDLLTRIFRYVQVFSLASLVRPVGSAITYLLHQMSRQKFKVNNYSGHPKTQVSQAGWS